MMAAHDVHGQDARAARQQRRRRAETTRSLKETDPGRKSRGSEQASRINAEEACEVSDEISEGIFFLTVEDVVSIHADQIER